MGPPKRFVKQNKPRKVQRLSFGHCYQLELVKHSDNEYAVHICCDADYRFGLGSGFISMSLNTMG